MEITSAKNPTYKYIKTLLLKKGRDESGLYTVEGIKSVSDAVSAGARIKYIVRADSFEQGDFSDFEQITVKSELFSGLCDTKTPQGVLAVIEKNIKGEFSKSGRYVYCDRIRDPGNLGTIIRTADAAGFSVLLSPECCELYSPKTVRASMGSFFHTKVYENVTYEMLKESGLHLIAGALSDKSKDFKKADYGKSLAVIVGNEANGVSDELLELCDELVIIPILGKAESLNAAVAAAILMYEAVR
ncbi:MAG: RNA methyltransferase [Clostridia bacterium]|nr:RNA methyltransferase [Clostridia bacterium]